MGKRRGAEIREIDPLGSRQKNTQRSKQTAKSELGTPAGGLAPEKRSHFVAIAASRHRAPAAAVRARVVVEKEAARGIRAAANRSRRTFNQEFGSRTGDGGKQPLEAALPSNEFERPGTFAEDKFIVSFRDAQDFVHGLGPGSWEGLAVHNASEDSPERLAKAKGTKEYGVDGAWFRREEREEARGAVLRDEVGVYEESDKVPPGEIASRGEVGEIERQTAGDER